jgi:hypothetical protein
MLRPQFGKDFISRFAGGAPGSDLLSAPLQLSVPGSLRIGIGIPVKGLDQEMSQLGPVSLAKVNQFALQLLRSRAHPQKLRGLITESIRSLE